MIMVPCYKITHRTGTKQSNKCQFTSSEVTSENVRKFYRASNIVCEPYGECWNLAPLRHITAECGSE